MDAALYGARLMNVLERSAPLVAMSAVSDAVNGWPGGVVQAGRDTLFVTPLYHAVRMWAEHRGDERLRVAADGPTFDGGAGTAGAVGAAARGVPWLDATASRAGDRVFVKLVNADATRALGARVELRGARALPDAEWELLASPDPAARNSFATPDAITPRRSTLTVAGPLDVRLPPGSVSVITFRVAR